MKKTNKVCKIVGIIFFALACVFLTVSAICVVSANKFKDNGIKTTATIVDLNGRERSSNSVTITYQVDGTDYEKTISEYSSSWDIGDAIDVYYKASNPNKVRIKSMMYFVPIIFGINGVVFLFVTIIILLLGHGSKKKQSRLMSEGKKVYAVITEVIPNYRVRVNGRNPYLAKAKYTDDYSGMVYDLKSRNFWEDSSELIGREVPVYINPKNPKDYYMDLEYLFGRKPTL